jgi:hypothetical protein
MSKYNCKWLWIKDSVLTIIKGMNKINSLFISDSFALSFIYLFIWSILILMTGLNIRMEAIYISCLLMVLVIITITYSWSFSLFYLNVVRCQYNDLLPPRYNWNIVESGVKRHNPNPTEYCHGNSNDNMTNAFQDCFNLYWRKKLSVWKYLFQVKLVF